MEPKIRVINIQLKEGIYITKRESAEDELILSGAYEDLAREWRDLCTNRESKATGKRQYLVYNTGEWSENVTDSLESITDYFEDNYKQGPYLVYRRKQPRVHDILKYSKTQIAVRV